MTTPVTGTFRGAWNTNTPYNLNDVVVYAGVDRIVTAAHTSGGTFDATKYTPLPATGAVLTTVPVKTGAYSANSGEVVPVDATTGTVPVGLPSAAGAGVGGTVVVKKIDATVNPVTVNRAGSDTINVSGTTANLTLSDEAMTFTSDGVSKWTITAGQKTLAGLSTVYVKHGDMVYNVLDYGADPTSGVSARAAVQAAIDACASTGGMVWVAPGIYKIDSALVPKAHVNFRGVGQGSRLNATNNPLFAWTAGRLTDFSMADMKLTGAGGYLFTEGPTWGANQCTFRRVQMIPADNTSGIWFKNNVDSFISMQFEQCDMWMTAGSTVPGFSLNGTGGAMNSARIKECTFNGQGNQTVEWFRVWENGTTYAYDWRFIDNIVEDHEGGFIDARSAQNWYVGMTNMWDASTAYRRHTLRFGRGSGGSAPASRVIVIDGLARRAPGALGIAAATTTIPGGVGTTGATTITVASAAGFPGSGNYEILVDAEVMLVTAGQGTTTWTVTRGYSNTIAATHAANAGVVAGVYDIFCPPADVVNATVRLLAGSTSGVSPLTTYAPGMRIEDMITASGVSDVQTFLTSGNWSPPAWAGPNCMTMGRLISGGGGGGGGPKIATGTNAFGGGGGGCGAVTDFDVPTGTLTAPVTVTVGVGGAGGAGATTNDTNGTTGGTGAQTLFGTYAMCGVNGATGGGGGTTTTGTAGANGTGNIGSYGVPGAGTAGVGTTASSGTAGSGGGGGGGFPTTPAANNGGDGGRTTGGNNVAAAHGVAGGAVDGAAGWAQPVGSGLPGNGGAGGASSITAAANAGNGGAGGRYGAGGGGGGAALNTAGNGGTGGAGSPGIAVIVTRL